MRIHRYVIVLFASTTVVLASTLLAGSGALAAGGSTTTSHSPNHPLAYVPLRGAKKAAPFDAVFSNMDYNGGPVMPSNTDYMVLWSPNGLDGYPDGYVSGLKTFFKDLAHDSGGHQNVDSVTAQYADLTGAFAQYKTTFGGALVVTDPYPASQCPVAPPVTHCLTDAQLQTELEHIVARRHLATDLSHEYFMLTPPHVEGCFTNNPTDSPAFGGCSAGEVPSTLAFYCAYHGNSSLSPMLLYADDPFVVSSPFCDDGNHPNGMADGELSGGLSHEQNESVSDPLPNDAWTNGAGPQQGFEIGDQCVGQMGTPLGTHNGAMYNQVINGHFYWYQEEWSNQTHSCLQRLTPAANRPVAKFTVKEGTGLTLKFDATGSSAPGGVADYVWQFNDSFGAQTVEMTTPKISHTFPSAGAYSVGLTIFESDGTSTGNGGIVRTGHSGTTPGFTLSNDPVHGHPATFTGLTNVSAQPVITYLWEFGDGTTGSGRSPNHTYRRAGTYTVTLVMFSGTGSAFPGQGAGPISTKTIRVD